MIFGMCPLCRILHVLDYMKLDTAVFDHQLSFTFSVTFLMFSMFLAERVGLSHEELYRLWLISDKVFPFLVYRYCTDYSCHVEVVDHLSLVPESVETFTYSISAQRELSLNPARNAASYLSSQGLDDFSIAFRNLSMRLRELHLEDVRISSALFWPVAEEKVDTKSLYWPNLEVLKILEAPPYTADGMFFQVSLCNVVINLIREMDPRQ
jgi:hypothetical protein